MLLVLNGILARVCLFYGDVTKELRWSAGGHEGRLLGGRPEWNWTQPYHMLRNETSMICVFRRWSKDVTEEKGKENGILWTQEGIFCYLVVATNLIYTHSCFKLNYILYLPAVSGSYCQEWKPHNIFLVLNHLLLMDNDRVEGEGTS